MLPPKHQKKDYEKLNDLTMGKILSMSAGAREKPKRFEDAELKDIVKVEKKQEAKIASRRERL